MRKIMRMITRDEVERFLSEFHTKMRVFNVVFLDRETNAKTLAELEITASDREEVLKEIKPEDYSEGPLLVDALAFYGPMWVFGKDVKGREVYIKIALCKTSSTTVCISFHIAEYPMSYPLKD